MHNPYTENYDVRIAMTGSSSQIAKLFSAVHASSVRKLLFEHAEINLARNEFTCVSGWK